MSDPLETLRFPLEDIRAVCRERTASAGDRDTDIAQLTERVVQLVARNISNGRFRRLASAQGNRLTLPGYVDCVLFHLRREQERVDALAAGDVVEWNRLLDFLRRRAYPMATAFRPKADAFQDACDFAQQALVVIFAQPYPFDVSFDAWAATILKNLVLERYTRSRDVLNQNTPPSSLDGPAQPDRPFSNSLGEMLANPDWPAPFDQVENQLLLLQAIYKLQSPAQQKVILWTYIEQWDDAHIARALRKTRQNVYNLRRRALLRLRAIIQQEE